MEGRARTPFRHRRPLAFAVLAAASCSCAAARQPSHLIVDFARLPHPQIRAQQAQPTPPSTVDHLHGVVVNSLTGKPVARVLVGGIGGLGFLTDSQGRFAFDLRRPLASPSGTTPLSGAAANLTTINLQFMLRRPGYIQRMASANLPMYTPSAAEPEVVLKITPGGIIAGHISLDSGAIPQNLNVQLRRRQIVDGSANYLIAANTQPDPEGNYRFIDLQPGDYKIFTVAHTNPGPRSGAGAAQPASIRGILPAFYPEAASLDVAVPIHLGAGSTLNADLSLRSATFYRVSVPVASSASGENIAAILNPDGVFFNLIYNPREGIVSGFLPPGTYNLQLNSAGPRIFPRTPSGSSSVTPVSGFPRVQDRETASLTLHVGSAPLRTPPVGLHPAPTVPIDVRRDFTETGNTQTANQRSSSNPPPTVSINLTALQSAAFQSTGNLETTPAGDLTLRNVSPGTYRVHANSIGTGYVSSLSCGGVDLLREPLVIGPDSDPPPIEVTLRNDSASLQVDLNDHTLPGESGQNPDDPLNAVSITAISLDAPERPTINGFIARHAPASLANLIAIGRSQLANMPPGRYLVLAFDAAPLSANQIEYHNPKVLESLIPKGVVITLTPNQKSEITVPVLPPPEAD